MLQQSAVVGLLVSAEPASSAFGQGGRRALALGAAWAVLLAVGCSPSSPTTQTTSTATQIPASVSTALSASIAALVADAGPGALGALGAKFALQAGVKATPVTLAAGAVASPPEEGSAALVADVAALIFGYEVNFTNSGATPSYSGLFVLNPQSSTSQYPFALAWGPLTGTATSPNSFPQSAKGFLVDDGVFQAATGSEYSQTAGGGATCVGLGSSLPSFITACTYPDFTGQIDIATSTQYMGSTPGPGFSYTPPGLIAGIALTIDCSQTSLCNNNPIQVGVSPQNATVTESQTQQFTATVTGTTNQAVTWSVVEAGGGGVGPTTGLYTAPSTAGGPFHVRATSQQDTSAFGEAAVTVVPGVGVAIFPPLDDPGAVVVPNGTLQFTAMVTGATNPAVTWSVVYVSGLEGGTITSGGLYTAPSTPGTYTVEATSVENPNVSATLLVTVEAITVSITPATATISLNGTQSLTATVTGTTQNTAVNLSVPTGDGTISPTFCSNSPCSLTYTAPSVPGTYFVTAVSSLAPSASVTAAMTVGQPTIDVQAVTAGGLHSCAVVNNNAWCWGLDNQGQLGDGAALGNTAGKPTPVEVVTAAGGPPLTGVTAIAAGYLHTCALLSSGVVQCWGATPGNGNAAASSTPISVPNLPGSVIAIAAGANHSCAVVSGGDVYCWGDNSSGQLGDGSTTAVSGAVQVVGANGTGALPNVTAVAGGQYHSCALDVNGAVWCWGYNFQGQLGSGAPYSSTPVTLPTQVMLVNATKSTPGTPLPSASAIAAGDLHSCAIAKTTGIWCWGYNYYGELGDGMTSTTTYSTTPVQVVSASGSGLLTGVQGITGGSGFTCAQLSGAAFCWGDNDSGQLGNNNSPTNSNVPVAVSGLSSGVGAVSAGGGQACVALSNGVECWGFNSNGQLGDNTQTNSPIPVAVDSTF